MSGGLCSFQPHRSLRRHDRREEPGTLKACLSPGWISHKAWVPFCCLNTWAAGILPLLLTPRGLSLGQGSLARSPSGRSDGHRWAENVGHDGRLPWSGSLSGFLISLHLPSPSIRPVFLAWRGHRMEEQERGLRSDSRLCMEGESPQSADGGRAWHTARPLLPWHRASGMGRMMHAARERHSSAAGPVTE